MKNKQKQTPSEKFGKLPVIENPFAEFNCPICQTSVDNEPDVCPTCGALLDYTSFLPFEFVNFDITPDNFQLLIDRYRR